MGAIYSTIERKDGDRLKGHPAQGHDEDQPDSMLQENGECLGSLGYYFICHVIKLNSSNIVVMFRSGH